MAEKDCSEYNIDWRWPGTQGEVNGPRSELIYQKYYYNQIRRSHTYSHIEAAGLRRGISGRLGGGEEGRERLEAGTQLQSQSVSQTQLEEHHDQTGPSTLNQLSS